MNESPTKETVTNVTTNLFGTTGTCTCGFADVPPELPCEAHPEKHRSYPGAGHPWADFLHHRARAIDWLYAEGVDGCKGNDMRIAQTLSMDPVQVFLIRTRDRSIPG